MPAPAYEAQARTDQATGRQIVRWRRSRFPRKADVIVAALVAYGMLLATLFRFDLLTLLVTLGVGVLIFAAAWLLRRRWSQPMTMEAATQAMHDDVHRWMGTECGGDDEVTEEGR